MNPEDGRVVSNFIVQALKGENITIFGDGNQTRSFQYVDDLVEGMIRMMNSKDNFLGPVNLGNPNEISIKDLAEKMELLITSKELRLQQGMHSKNFIAECYGNKAIQKEYLKLLTKQ